MTPTQKIKWAILAKAASWNDKPLPAVTAENVDELYDALVAVDGHWDAKNEVRCSGQPSGIPCKVDVMLTRHYDHQAVAAKMPDGSWVGWVYWHGGGKFGEPDAIDWMEHAYALDCAEREVIRIERTFSLAAA